MSATNQTSLSATDYITALSTFDESDYEAIIKRINGIREERKSETTRQIAELEAQLKELKAKSPSIKTYGRIVNPNNPNEVYTTGGYPVWLKDEAKKEGVDVYDDKAMAKWVKMKKAQ